MSGEIKEFKPSPQAEAQDVCHTKEECAAMYAAFTSERKAPAMEFIRKKISLEDRTKIQMLIDRHGKEKWLWHLYDDQVAKLTSDEKQRGLAVLYNPHLRWGMAMRNLLREGGFGESYFAVHNLDDIYVELITEAITGEA